MAWVIHWFQARNSWFKGQKSRPDTQQVTSPFAIWWHNLVLNILFWWTILHFLQNLWKQSQGKQQDPMMCKTQCCQGLWGVLAQSIPYWSTLDVASIHSYARRTVQDRPVLVVWQLKAFLLIIKVETLQRQLLHNSIVCQVLKKRSLFELGKARTILQTNRSKTSLSR